MQRKRFFDHKPIPSWYALFAIGYGTVLASAAAVHAAEPAGAPVAGAPIPAPAAAEAPDQASAPTEVTRSDAPVRVVVIPVVVGASREPDPALVEAVARGLAGNRRWDIQYGRKDHPLAVDTPMGGPAGLSGEPAAELENRLADAKADLDQGRNDEAAAKFEALFASLEETRRAGPIGASGRALLARIGAGLVQALAASGTPQPVADNQRLQDASQRVALSLPGHKFAESDGLSPVAAALLAAAAAAPKAYCEVEIVTRPVGCVVMVDGFALGVAPVKFQAAPGATHHVGARCSGAATAPSPARKIVAGLAGESQRRVLDLVFDKDLTNDASGTRLRFGSPADRRQLEESYARRAAETFAADSVVFVSLGELGGNEWLNARLYLRSGFKNRQGLARLEVPRAVALGHYIASGQDSIGVLRAQEAGEMVAASRLGPRPIAAAPPSATPWYADVTGWALTGAGALAFGLGYHLDNRAAEIQLDAALNARNDPFKRQDLQAQAQKYQFWGSIGMFGGGLMAAMGVVLLIAPDYGQSRSELFVLAPTSDGTGAQMRYFGRF